MRSLRPGADPMRSLAGALCELVDRDLTEQERCRYFPGGRAEPACEG